jgi:hypothetical protein
LLLLLLVMLMSQGKLTTLADTTGGMWLRRSLTALTIAVMAASREAVRAAALCITPGRKQGWQGAGGNREEPCPDSIQHCMSLGKLDMEAERVEQQ